MRAFHGRVELVDASGTHLRWLPRARAAEMVAGGTAEVLSANGRVKVIRLVTPASQHAERTGKPDGAALFGTKFVRREVLETSGTKIWAHHPRATY